jgi:hypothetical protein
MGDIGELDAVPTWSATRRDARGRAFRIGQDDEFARLFPPALGSRAPHGPEDFPGSWPYHIRQYIDTGKRVELVLALRSPLPEPAEQVRVIYPPLPPIVNLPAQRKRWRPSRLALMTCLAMLPAVILAFLAAALLTG